MAIFVKYSDNSNYKYKYHIINKLLWQKKRNSSLVMGILLSLI